MEIPKFLKRIEDVNQSKFGVEYIQVIVLHVRGKMLKLTKTKFNDIEKCKPYLEEIISDNKIISSSKNNEYLTLNSGIHVCMNYSYKKILRGKKPKNKLRDIFFDTREMPSVRNVSWKKSKSQPKKEVRDMTVGNLIPIKLICRDNDIDPRIARGILRGSKDPLVVSHKNKGRWEFTKTDVPKILSIILEGIKK